MNQKLLIKNFLIENPHWSAKANSKLIIMYLSNQVTKTQFDFVLSKWQKKQDNFYEKVVDMFGHKD